MGTVCEGCGRSGAPLLSTVYYVAMPSALGNHQLGHVQSVERKPLRVVTSGWKYVRRFSLEMCGDCWKHKDRARLGKVRWALQQEGLMVDSTMLIDNTLLSWQGNVHYGQLSSEVNPVMMTDVVRDDFDVSGRTACLTVQWKGLSFMMKTAFMLAVDGIIEAAGLVTKDCVVQLPVRPGPHELGVLLEGVTGFETHMQYKLRLPVVAPDGGNLVFDLHFNRAWSGFKLVPGTLMAPAPVAAPPGWPAQNPQPPAQQGWPAQNQQPQAPQGWPAQNPQPQAPQGWPAGSQTPPRPAQGWPAGSQTPQGKLSQGWPAQNPLPHAPQGWPAQNPPQAPGQHGWPAQNTPEPGPPKDDPQPR